MKEKEESNLIRHAKNEMIIAWGDFDKMDDMQNYMCDQVLEIIKLISTQGDSGSSIHYKMNLLNKLVNFETISPLTFETEEFGEPFNYKGARQNKRNSSFFMDGNGDITYNDGFVFTSDYVLRSDSLEVREGSKTAWHSSVYVVNSEGNIIGVTKKAYLKSKKYKKFSIKSYELEYPQGWWLRFVKEEDMREALEYYDCINYDMDYVNRRLEGECNFKGGIYKDELKKRIEIIKKYMLV